MDVDCRFDGKKYLWRELRKNTEQFVINKIEEID